MWLAASAVSSRMCLLDLTSFMRFRFNQGVPVERYFGSVRLHIAVQNLFVGDWLDRRFGGDYRFSLRFQSGHQLVDFLLAYAQLVKRFQALM
jgi:hypothetical protein